MPNGIVIAPKVGVSDTYDLVCRDTGRLLTNDVPCTFSL